ncbi:hypothetical protein EG329_014252 [Mollisiaceae sp. DMI_Dod_QoI]|nr:hypothetical protein EG329_014252 [Helotiales sp. DMI_Dod_QoI]
MKDAYYRKGGPVFFYDGGEAGLNDRAAAQMLGGDILFAPLELARKHHGIVIIWEHRFFGESMPFETNGKDGIAVDGFEAYGYLNNEQALEDVVSFAQNFQPAGHGNDELSSDSTPWIAMGGSYAGVRAAMMRLRNPEVFFASWSSSAPVQTEAENSEYYNNIVQSMPANCSADVHAAITHADEILLRGNDEEIALLKQVLFLTNNATFGGSQDMITIPGERKADDITYFDAASILATAFHTFPAFQMVGYRSLDKFCNYLETWNPKNATQFTLTSPISVLADNSFDASPTFDGLRSKYGSETAFYAFIGATIRSSRPLPDSPSRQIGSKADRASWTWMLCNEFAQFPVSEYPSPASIISRFNNISAVLDNFCQRQFSYLPPQPKVKQILKYGGWNMKPSNVMFTNGEIDPWRALSIQSSKDINPHALDRTTTQTVPLCNVAPSEDEVFGIVYEGAVHVSDLRRRREDRKGNVDKGLELFEKALDAWLPCFRPRET